MMAIMRLLKARMPEVGSVMVFPVVIFIAPWIKSLPNILIEWGFLLLPMKREPMAISYVFVASAKL